MGRVVEKDGLEIKMFRLWNRIFKYYGYVITVVFALLFYSNILIYIFTIDISLILPRYYIYVFILLTAPYLFSYKISRNFIKSPLLLWCFIYLFIVTVWYIPDSQSVMVQDLFMQRIGAVIFLSLSLFVISNVAHGVNSVRWVILICVLLAVINNLYEIFHPFSFVPPGYDFSRIERSAGFYINPNQSGAALVLGLIFSIGLIPKIYRVPYTILTLLGVLLTFSRASILGWFVVVTIMVKQKTLRGKECLIGLVLITAMGLMLTPLLLDFIEVERGIYLVDVHERIDWFGSLGEISIDASQEERLFLSRRSWDLFVNHPFIGNGMGSTETWSERTSTHNMYLYFMADYGIIGVFFLPLLVLSVTCLARGQARRMAIPFSAFVLFWGFFSHNIVGEYYFLLSFALMAMVSAKRTT